MIQRRLRLLMVAVCITCVGSAAAWQTTDPQGMADELIAQERLRLAVQEALELYQQPVENGDVQNDNFVNAVDHLVETGPGVVPLLVNELDQALPSTYYFCAYALGRLGTPAAAEGLRGAIEKAERERGSWAEARKAWAGYGLGLTGEAEAINLLLDGRHLAGHLPMHQGMSVLEAVALQTAPACVPLLHAQLDRLRETPEQRGERHFVLHALRRTADPSSVKKLEQAFKAGGDLATRRWTARALASIESPEALAAALRIWDDEDAPVRRIVCLTLEDVVAPVDTGLIRGRLQAETDSVARGALYRMLADRDGAAAVAPLEQHWGRPDPRDRLELVRALGLTLSAEAVPLLHRALLDADNRVASRAATSLSEIGTKPAIDLLIQAVGSRRATLTNTAVEQLVAREERRASEAIYEKLLATELAGVVNDATRRYRIELLAESLVALRDPRRLDDLREATARQRDPLIKAALTRVVAGLQALQENGTDRERWVETARSEQSHLRSLAYQRLAEIGGEESARVLAGVFGRVGPEEGAEILEALRHLEVEPALALIERVLLAPEFDPIERAGLRAAAAWSAWRLGGERMLDALQRSVERRAGRDAKVTVYLALLGQERALPVLERVRLTRMLFLKWSRGNELETLDRLSRRSAAGCSLTAFEVPPEKLPLR